MRFALIFTDAVVVVLRPGSPPAATSIAAAAAAETLSAALLRQVIVLTPYLARLREIQDEIDGTVSAQDAFDLAAAIRLGDGTNHKGSGKSGKNGSPGGDKGEGGGGKGGRGGGGGSGFPAVSRKRVRVATGEGLMVTASPVRHFT